VVVAIDASAHAENAFNCKYIIDISIRTWEYKGLSEGPKVTSLVVRSSWQVHATFASD
jgi:hypothetical protein